MIGRAQPISGSKMAKVELILSIKIATWVIRPRETLNKSVVGGTIVAAA